MTNALRWQATDPLAGWTLHATVVFDQNAFRFRMDDGGEAGATWLAAENTNLVSYDLDVTENIRVRLASQETGGGASNNADFTLQYSLNGGGWLDVNGSTVGVVYRTSAFVANQTPTTDQLTTPTGTFLAGAFISDSESTARTSFSGNDHTENEFSLRLITADLSNGDTIDFRMLVDGGTLDTYSVTPSLTVAIAEPTAPTEAPVLTSPAQTDTTIDLDWNSVPDATSYVVEQLNGSWVQVYSGAATNTTITGLTQDTPYTFRVRGVNDVGDGPNSNELTVSTDFTPEEKSAAFVINHTQSVDINSTSLEFASANLTINHTQAIEVAFTASELSDDASAELTFNLAGTVIVDYTKAEAPSTPTGILVSAFNNTLTYTGYEVAS